MFIGFWKNKTYSALLTLWAETYVLTDIVIACIVPTSRHKFNAHHWDLENGVKWEQSCVFLMHINTLIKYGTYY